MREVPSVQTGNQADQSQRRISSTNQPAIVADLPQPQRACPTDSQTAVGTRPTQVLQYPLLPQTHQPRDVSRMGNSVAQGNPDLGFGVLTSSGLNTGRRLRQPDWSRRLTTHFSNISHAAPNSAITTSSMSPRSNSQAYLLSSVQVQGSIERLNSSSDVTREDNSEAVTENSRTTGVKKREQKTVSASEVKLDDLQECFSDTAQKRDDVTGQINIGFEVDQNTSNSSNWSDNAETTV